MRHLFLEIPRARRRPLFLLFFGLAIITMLALNLSGRPLVTEAAPSGILSYEFAGDVVTADEIISSWDSTARIYAGFNLGLDYLYLFLYANAIAMALLWLTDGLPARGIVSLAVILALGQWLAAALDAIENYALFTMLVTAPSTPWPQVAWWCAAVKFALVFAGLLLVLVVAIVRASGRLRQAE